MHDVDNGWQPGARLDFAGSKFSTGHLTLRYSVFVYWAHFGPRVFSDHNHHGASFYSLSGPSSNHQDILANLLHLAEHSSKQREISSSRGYYEGP